MSGSFLDCTASPDKALVDGTEPAIDTPRKGSTARQQVFLELLQTECNYAHFAYYHDRKFFFVVLFLTNLFAILTNMRVIHDRG